MTIGTDRSSELIEFARTQSLQKMSSTRGKGKGKQTEVAGEDNEAAAAIGKPINEVAIGDALSTGFRSRAFVSSGRHLEKYKSSFADYRSVAFPRLQDYAISIATIHHLSTRQRRKESISELIRLIRPVSVEENMDGGGRGRFLVYVWALEQKGQERRKFDEQDRERQVEGSKGDSEAVSPAIKEGRDVLVPWVLKTQATEGARGDKNGVAESKDGKEEKVYQRCAYQQEMKRWSTFKKAVLSLLCFAFPRFSTHRLPPL